MNVWSLEMATADSDKIEEDVHKIIYIERNTPLDAVYYSNPQRMKEFYIQYTKEVLLLLDGVDLDVYKLTYDKSIINRRKEELNKITTNLRSRAKIYQTRYNAISYNPESLSARQIGIYPVLYIKIEIGGTPIGSLLEIMISSKSTICVSFINLKMKDPLDPSNNNNNPTPIQCNYENNILKITYMYRGPTFQFDLSDIADTLFLTPTQIKEAEKKKKEEKELEKLKKQFLESLSDEVAKKAIEEYKASKKKKQTRKLATKMIEPAHEYDSGEEFD